MSIDPETTVVIGNGECPETPIEFTAEQLAPMLKALKASIIITAQSYYTYLHKREDVSPGMQDLFNQYTPIKKDRNTRWREIDRLFKGKDSAAFSALLATVSSKLKIDTEMQLYADARDGYTLMLPPPRNFARLTTDEDKVYAACLNLFQETRLTETENFMSSRTDNGEGKHYDVKTSEGAARIVYEFDEAKNLCRFMNHCAPAGVRFSIKDLQMTRH